MYDFSYDPVLLQIDEKVLTPISQGIEKNWSSEEQAYYKLRPRKDLGKIASREEELSFDLNLKRIKILPARTKFSLLIICKLLRIKFSEQKGIILLWVDRVEEELMKKYLHSEGTSSALHFLDNIHTIIFLRDYFNQKRNVRSFFSLILGRNSFKIQGKEIKSSLELIITFFQFRMKRTTPKKPKPKTFRRGYRDHGSLGSEMSKTLKDQARDFELQESERKRKQASRDSHLFVEGFFE